jgi:hypothetical protein
MLFFALSNLLVCLDDHSTRAASSKSTDDKSHRPDEAEITSRNDVERKLIFGIFWTRSYTTNPVETGGLWYSMLKGYYVPPPSNFVSDGSESSGFVTDDFSLNHHLLNEGIIKIIASIKLSDFVSISFGIYG